MLQLGAGVFHRPERAESVEPSRKSPMLRSNKWLRASWRRLGLVPFDAHRLQWPKRALNAGFNSIYSLCFDINSAYIPTARFEVYLCH